MSQAGDKQEDETMTQAGRFGAIHPLDAVAPLAPPLVESATPTHDTAVERAPRSRALLVLGAALIIALIGAGALTVLLLSTRGDLHAARSSIAEYKAAERKRLDDAAAKPDLMQIARNRFASTKVDPSGDAKSVSVTIYDRDVSAAGPALSAMLTDLGFSEATLARMNHTRALDGTQRAEGRNVNATWTYHPDHGLSVVFEAE